MEWTRPFASAVLILMGCLCTLAGLVGLGMEIAARLFPRGLDIPPHVTCLAGGLMLIVLGSTLSRNESD